MKKIVVTIFIFLFAAADANSTGLYKRKTTINEEHREEVYKETPENPDENSVLGLFRSSDPDLSRPDSKGIGLERLEDDAPIGDGLHILIICCVVLAVLKIVKRRRRGM